MPLRAATLVFDTATVNQLTARLMKASAWNGARPESGATDVLAGGRAAGAARALLIAKWRALPSLDPLSRRS
jgi:hypothetical protein